MSWSDAALLALRSLRRRGGRSLLTGLGVTLGTTLLVALLSIAATADSRIVSQLSKGGPAAAIHVDDAYPDPSNLTSDNLKTGAHHDLGEQEVSAVRRSPHVGSVVTVLSVPVLALPCPGVDPAPTAAPACRRSTEAYVTTLVGSDLRRTPDLPVTLLAGRLPRPGSLTEVAVTQNYVERLRLDAQHPTPVLGSEVEFAAPQAITSGGQTRFRGRWSREMVVGVVAQTVDDGEFLVPIEQTQAAREWSIQGIQTRGLPRPGSPYSGLVVVADSLADVHAVRAEIAGLGFATSAPEHLVASVQKYLHIVDIVLGGIGAVALAIAVLGVANSLLAAVRERWREIGVLKALGASDGDVARWFLVEAGLLGLVGGLAGAVAGTVLAGTVALVVNHYLVEQGLQGVDIGLVPPGWVLAVPLITALLAVAGGLAPALRAAALPVREALGG
ncbi:ABC transporter permease [Candidatus Nephthysia bennettiae]|uniref:ABC transporter permease n=1 Tax=Candidatus Nephthysia bennettiae TaxID=3127016 RepID=A0A934JX65_9BACT|nr:ABC transporter permease [Candidatus Dormibacteraeota bacterium]MBJ7612694.1 ABC transporter permease [Candidatus Dormibacteraeota bacterium]